MADIAASTGAPITRRIGRREFELHPLTLSDLGRIVQKMRCSLVEAGREAMRDPTLGRDDKALILDQAYRAAERTGWTADALVGFQSDPSMLLQFIYASVRRTDPKLTIEQVADAVGTDVAGLTSAFEDVLRLSGMVEDAADGTRPKSGGGEAAPGT